MLRSAIAFLSLALLAPAAAGQEAKFVPTDEFHGPFPNWRDVKRDYGARGDGVADDSGAINKTRGCSCSTSFLKCRKVQT